MAVSSQIWRVRGGRELDAGEHTIIMGVLNVTPDSFSDGGVHFDAADAIRSGEEMAAEGADILDIGGESSRPGRAEELTDAQEWERIAPVLIELRRRLPGVVLSVDTYREETARRALAEGADVVNDIYALRRSPGLAAAVAEAGAGLVLMHMQGEPATMQQEPQYGDLLVEVKDFLQERMDVARAAGVAEEAIVVDPGIGFGKTNRHNVQLLAGLEYLRLLQRPLVVGASRKAFLGHLTGVSDAGDRAEASLAAACAAVMAGASVVRVHDVKATRRALAVIDAVRAEM